MLQLAARLVCPTHTSLWASRSHAKSRAMNVRGVQVKETTNSFFFFLFRRLNGTFPPNQPSEAAERAGMVPVTVPM